MLVLVNTDERNDDMALTQYEADIRTSGDRDPQLSLVPGGDPDGTRRRRTIVGAAILAALILGAGAVALRSIGTTTDPASAGLDPRTRQVPSGSPFDAPNDTDLGTAQVPSGSPFDAPNATPDQRTTEPVPSGSPFDAPEAPDA